MFKVKSGLVFFLVFLLTPIFSWAQIEEEFDLEGREETETTDQVKEIESKIGLWYMKGHGAFVDSTKLDTLLDYFHIYHPGYKDALTATYVGNYGTPIMNNDYFKRDPSVSYFFLRSRQDYVLTPGQITYFNTTTPYTRFDYSQSENKSKNNETRFKAVHSQNVNPYLNFTFLYNIGKSEGQYTHQAARVNNVTLYSSYDKDNFAIYSGFISNSLKNEENGGLTHEDLLESGKKPEYWNVNLNSSNSLFGSVYYYTQAEYRLGKWLEDENEQEWFKPFAGIIYSFNYERNKQEFEDKEDDSNEFFENTYYDDTYTKDSIRFNRIDHLVQLKQYENPDRKFSFGKRAFLGHEYARSSMPGILGDEIYRMDKKYNNLYVGGGIFRETGKFWTWNFEGKFYLVGRNIGQTELNGVISKPFTFLKDSAASITFTGNISNLKPDIFQEEFYSNHYRWKNDLNMEQRMVAGGVFNMPKRKLSAGANYALINNFLYNNTEGIPSQTGKELLILSAFLDKDFNYRNLHLRTRLLWQQASNEEYIHLPEFSAFVSGWFQFLWSKVLLTQIGVDARYNTAYYADAYAPSTGLFYLQNEKEYGNYPYIDVYASLRLKRTRVFFKWMNIGTNFLDGEYINTPFYPMYRSTFRLGLSWAFYD